MGGWTSPPHALSGRDPSFKTFWKLAKGLTSVDAGTSWIDHILLHSNSSTTVTPMAVELSLGPYWLTCTDHRPIVITAEGVVFDPLQVKSGRPRQVTSFRRRDLQRTDKEAVAEYKASLLAEFTHWPPAAGLTPDAADGTEEDSGQIAVGASGQGLI